MSILEPKLSANALKIVTKRYLRTDMGGKVIETPGEMLWRVAKHLAKAEIHWGDAETVQKTAEQFYQRMIELKFVVAGKAMFEAGNPGGNGQLSSCFVLPVEDNIRSIFKTLGDAAVVHKNNGGTGFNFSRIRPGGDKVKNVPGASSGPVDFLSAYSAALGKILQGSKRQGANIGILNCDHPDIIDFITLKDEDGTISNFNISVGVTNKFLEAVEQDKMWELINPRSGEVAKRIRARKLFDLIAEHAWATGDPGLAFLDRLEADNPTPSLGKIDCTNPCITGDALVPTDDGLISLDQLQNTHQIVVDKRTQDMQGTALVALKQASFTGEKPVFQLTTKAGYAIKATADHKFLTNKGWKPLGKLTVKDNVFIQSGSGVFPSQKKLPFEVKNSIKGKNGRTYNFNLPRQWSRELGQFIGWIVGDGFIRQDKKNSLLCITFGNLQTQSINHFKSLIEKWSGRRPIELLPNNRTIQLRKRSKFIVEYLVKLGVSQASAGQKHLPQSIFTAPKTAVIGFLQGLMSADGTVGFVEGKSAYIRLTSKSITLLQQVQILLLNLNIKAKIYNRSRKPRANLFPQYQSAKGEIKSYQSDGLLWELEISKDCVPTFLKNIGFMFDLHQEKVKKLNQKTYYKTQFEDQVQSIIPLGVQEVYDVTEPETHSFIANGFVVHNCGEIPLLPYESCNLTSLVLSNHLKPNSKGGLEIDWNDLEKSIKIAIRLLDNMIEVNTYALPEIEDMVKNGNRRIGLGVMGFAHLLYKLNIPYDSNEAVRLSERLSKFIRRKSEEMSFSLGKTRGVFPNWDRSIYAGTAETYRNCALTMIAPTGTISMMADCSSGIEPVFSLVTLRKTFFEDNKKNTPTAELIMVDPIFEEFIQTKISDKTRREKVLKQIAETNSLQDIPEITPEEAKVFNSTHHIKPQWHIRIQAAWQKYFDNSVSKTINFKSSATDRDIKKAYMLAWKLGCKGITIYRDGSKEHQVLNLSAKPPGKTTKQDENTKPKLKTISISQVPTTNQNTCPDCGSTLKTDNSIQTCYS
jgi:ribonucleoside-diphosphate reductase alpha chain